MVWGFKNTSISSEEGSRWICSLELKLSTVAILIVVVSLLLIRSKETTTSNKSFPANHFAKVEAETYDSVMTVPNFEVLQQRGLRMTPLQRVSLLEVGPNTPECVLQQAILWSFISVQNGVKPTSVPQPVVTQLPLDWLCIWHLNSASFHFIQGDAAGSMQLRGYSRDRT